ncbi:MAG: glycosyltransferase family 4 protein [Chitinophagaceae bacterium]|nr:glycosyltransferase family 4 protein [Chitinophagaceae bacterium]
MKITKSVVIIGPAFPLRGGGLSTFNERLAREFNNQGYKTQIYTFSLQYPTFLFPGTSQYSTDVAPKDLDIKVCINSINPFNWIKVGMELSKLKPDLIVVRFWIPFMGPCLGTILKFVRKNQHTRIVCIADNIIPHEKRFGDNLLTKYFIKPIHAFITMSENVFSDLRKFEPIKPAILVNHPLYDNFGAIVPKTEARNHLQLPIDKKIILFFGFIRHYKGLDLLIEAMADQRVKDAEIVLLVAGEFYKDPKPYLEQIKHLGLEKSIILKTQFIQDDEVRYYICASDLVVQPYRNATQSGVTPLAYHFEKPMLVTNVGGLPMMVPNGKVGLVAEPNPKSLADSILEYFKRGEEYFLPNLKEEKTKYSWDIFLEKTIALAKESKV